jgi:hypothetical protein
VCSAPRYAESLYSHTGALTVKIPAMFINNTNKLTTGSSTEVISQRKSFQKTLQKPRNRQAKEVLRPESVF